MATVKSATFRPQFTFPVCFPGGGLSAHASRLKTSCARRRKRLIAGSAAAERPSKWLPPDPASNGCSERRCNRCLELHPCPGPPAAEMCSNGGPRRAPENCLQPHSHSRARVSDPYATGLTGWSRSLLVGCAFWDFLDTSLTYHPDDTAGELSRVSCRRGHAPCARRFVRKHE